MTPAQLAVERDRLLEGGRTLEEVERGQAAMASPTVYLVIGVCGEYSDRTEWVVAAYFDKALAERHADLATEEEIRIARAWEAAGYEAFELRYNSDGISQMPSEEIERRRAMRVNRYDAKVQRDYTGTDYHAAEVADLRLALPLSPPETAAGASAHRPQGETP